MKNRVWFVLLLCASLLLTACTATDPNNLFETTEGNPADTTAATVAATVSTEPSEESKVNDFDASVMFEEGYQYGNMQKNVPPGSFMRLGNQVLFDYHTDMFRLYTYDLTTGEVSSFCKDATCKHKSCASSKLWGNIEVYKGSVYSMTEGRKIVEIRDDEQIPLSKGMVDDFFHHNDKLYARTPDSSLVVFEEGSDQPKVIIEEYAGCWNVIFGQYLYGNWGGIYRIDLLAEHPKQEEVVSNASGIVDGHHIYYVDKKTNFLYRCNMDGSNSQILVEQAVLQASMNFDDKYFYYRLYTDQQLDTGEDCHDIYRFPKDDPSQIEKIVTLEEAAYQVFTVPGSGKIFVLARRTESGEQVIYVMGTDGSNPTRLEIPEY